jgi:uncharacterized protein YndB with AHSA1/START domain
MRVDTAHRRIAALPEEVFRAFRDPGLLAVWLPPEGMQGHLEHLDLRAGGGFRTVLTYETHDAPGKYSAHSDVAETKILSMEPPRRVVWSVQFPSDDPAFAGTMFMEWTFEAVLSADPDQTPGSQVHAEVGTEVTVQAKDVPYGIDAGQHVAGMQSSLAKLAALFEHRSH